MMLDQPMIQVTHINDVMPAETFAHLLRYDTVHGALPRDIVVEGDGIVVDRRHIIFTRVPTPAEFSSKDLEVDVLVEASGRDMGREGLEYFFRAGAGRVILACPGETVADRTVVFGVNEGAVERADRILSNASCTAHCVCPVLEVLEKSFGIESAFLNNVHPYTNSQNLVDSPHADLRRARAASSNIIPTSTTAIDVACSIIPALQGRFAGISTRVPVNAGALAEMVLVLRKDVTPTEVNQRIRNAAEGPMRGIIQYCTDPIVSSDIIGNRHSSILDSLMTKAVNGTTVQLLSWYDNECGFASRIVDLVLYLGQLDEERHPTRTTSHSRSHV